MVFFARGKKRSSSGNPALRSGIPLASNSPKARRQHLVIPNYCGVAPASRLQCCISRAVSVFTSVISRTSQHIPWKPKSAWLRRAVHGTISEMRKIEDDKTSQKVPLHNCSYLQCSPVRLNTLCNGIESNSGTSEDPIQIAKMHVSSAGKGVSILN
eukprot:s995_g3.t1